jgi:hypothetical protein
MADKPYFITAYTPLRLRKLLIQNPFLPTLYENIRSKRPLNYSIASLDNDDGFVEFIVEELIRHGLVEKVGDEYEAKYSRIIPPQYWDPHEDSSYIANVLSDLKDLVAKEPEKKVTFGNLVGNSNMEEFLAFAESQLLAGESLTENPNGSVEFQFAFILKEI